MFKKFFFFLGFFCISLLSISSVLAIDKTALNLNEISPKKNRPKYVADEILIKFKKDKVNLQNTGLLSFFRELSTSLTNNLEKNDVLKSGNIVVYKIKDGRSVEDVIDEVKNDSNVELVQPNYYSYLSSLGTDDIEKNNLWGLDNFGQTITKDSGVTTTGIADVDIDMPEAWSVSSGNSDVIVAIIDSGVAYNHPDLVDNMWDGNTCKDENGSTITGGCIHGYDFVNNSNNPAPTTSSHGTHIAGVIAGSVNNSLGIAGVGKRTKIMALKCEDADGFIDSDCIIKSIDFAIQNGAKVINASFGSSYYDSLQYQAIDRFKTAGGIFVAAAGNGGTDGKSDNNDITHTYPSDYDLNNIISVAATDNKDELANFSNYGATSVDVGAPGVSILSTVIYKKQYYENFSNLSQESSGADWYPQTNSNGSKMLWNFSANYLNNVNYTISTLNAIDLSSVDSLAKFNFYTRCEDSGTTTPEGIADSDYMALEVSGDGVNFTEIYKWNSSSISTTEDSSCSLGKCGNTLDLNIDNSYLTNNFKYRLRWVTDGSGNSGEGCLVSDIKIINYPTNGAGADYDYMQGTSMAAPYVAGLAGYLLSVNSSATYTEIKNNIETNGDSISSLSGKTTSGKRINAFNSVSNIGIGGTTTPTPTPTPTETTTPTPTPTGTGDTTPTPTPTPTGTGDTTPTPIYINGANINTLIGESVFVIPVGDSATLTTKVVVSNEVFITVGEGTSLISVEAFIDLAKDTEITRENNEVFDSTQISAINMNKNIVSGLTSGFSARNLMQWGIPEVTLMFNKPVFISMYVGNEYDGQTLSILRSPTTTSGWTNEGLVNSNCLIIDGYCDFSTNKASYFTVVSYSAVTTGNNSNSSNSSDSGHSSYVCNDVPPIKGPDLFELKANKGKVKLIYTPGSTATAYAVLYGFKKGDERFGAIVSTVNNNNGVQNGDIFALDPKSTYYFKVAAINGCTISSWSEWIPVRANKTRTIYKYKTIIKNKIKTLVNIFK